MRQFRYNYANYSLNDREPKLLTSDGCCADSVHNDGERHIPYLMIFPDSTINKMRAWASFQLDNGMIQEQLRCGCQSLPILPIVSDFHL